MSFTFDTSEDPISWLKELALQNFGSFASHGKHQKGKGVVSRNNIVHGIFLEPSPFYLRHYQENALVQQIRI
jgi:hypothetical protein